LRIARQKYNFFRYRKQLMEKNYSCITKALIIKP
jgi:hypothetical protein